MRKGIFLLIFCCIGLGAAAQSQRHMRARQKMEEARARKEYKPAGYPNVLTASFPQFISISSTFLIGTGLEYERYIIKDGLLSVHLPVYVTIADPFGVSSRGSGTKRNAYFLAPGVRLHPFGNKGRADLSIGMQGYAGNLRTSVYQVKGTISSAQRQTDYSLFGVGGEADLDLHPTEHL